MGTDYWVCLSNANQKVKDFDHNVSYGFRYHKGHMVCFTIGNTGFLLFKTGNTEWNEQRHYQGHAHQAKIWNYLADLANPGAST